MDDIEQSLMAQPALRRLEALMPGGLASVDEPLRRALGDDDVSRALRLANQRYGRRGVDDYNATLAYACVLVGRELLVEAVDLCQKALQAHPAAPAFQSLMADAQVSAGQLDEAGDLLDRIEVDGIERADVSSFVGDIYVDLGDEDAAIAWYERAVDGAVADPEPAIRLGQLLVGRDALERAAASFEYAANLVPERRGLWQICADLWFEIGDDARGLRAIRRVVELGEPDADDWLELGLRLAQFGDSDAALETLSKAVDWDPFAVDARLVRGNVLLELGRAEEARASFEAIVEFRPNHHGAHRGLAAAALLMGDLSLARAHVDRASERGQDDPEVQFIGGRISQQYGRHTQAIDAFDQALQARPDQPTYLSAKALSEASLGHIDQARALLAEVVDQARAHPDCLPIQLDIAGWERVQRGLDAEQAGWFGEQTEFLGRQS